MIDWINKRAFVAKRAASVCSGTFLLGTAGLLNKRVVTTHWAGSRELQSRFPEALVESDRLFHRDGAQSQFSTPLHLQTEGGDRRLVDLIPWIQNNIHYALTVSQIAHKFNLSERSLHRLCTGAFGFGPGRLVTELRLERARELLQQPHTPIKKIARDTGFSSTAALSKAFCQKYGVAPSHYRSRFSQPAQMT